MGKIVPIERTVAIPRRGESPDVIAQLEEIADLAISEGTIADHDIIRLWCGLLPPDDDRYESIVNDFDMLAPGTRILYPDMLHGGILHDGKYTSMTPNPNPRAKVLYSLSFVLPVYEANNPLKVKPLPVPHDRLVSGTEAVVASLNDELRGQSEQRSRMGVAEGFRVDTYLRVARTMRSLGWDISGASEDVSIADIQSDFRVFTYRAVQEWIQNSTKMPKSVLEGLLTLSVELGEEQEAKTTHALASHVREGLETQGSASTMGAKAIAAYTSFTQRNSKLPNYTREQAIADLLTGT